MSKNWNLYKNGELKLKNDGDHLDTELIQLALFGVGKNESEEVYCLTCDPINKIKARIKLVSQVLVEYETWRKRQEEQEELPMAPDIVPDYVAILNSDCTYIKDVIDVKTETKPYFTYDSV